MQDDAADELHFERALAKHAVGRLTDGGERFGKDCVQRLPLFQPTAQFIRHAAQLRVAVLPVPVLQSLYLLHNRHNPLEFAALYVQIFFRKLP